MKLFISYAHTDKSILDRLVQYLGTHEVWFDDRLNLGDAWWNKIEQQIALCHCFVFLISVESLRSEYCQKELDVALRLEKRIAPVKTQDIETNDIPESLNQLQIIPLIGDLSTNSIVAILNGLFEIERALFNPLRVNSTARNENRTKLQLTDLRFVTSNERKASHIENIIGTNLQISQIDIGDVQHLDVGEVALKKVKQAHSSLKKPVIVEQSGLAIRVWGGLPGGMTTSIILPLGLNNLCKMLNVFTDKYAEAVSVIAFTDGILIRKFVGVLKGEIVDQPRGKHSRSWGNIFVPDGWNKTLGEMSDDEFLSISMRRRAVLDLMKFLQENYEVE